MNPVAKILATIGSSASIGFGIWHFFVPVIWKWYSYVDINATELITAVRAINAFFSLSLVLFGIIDILLIYGDKSNRYSILVVFTATCILWMMRVGLQIFYPQGSFYPGLQYGMLAVFTAIAICYALALLDVVFSKPVVW